MEWGRDSNQTSLYTLNAKTQVTLWGPPDGMIFDYAGKLWNGLVGTFYVSRWQFFFEELENCLTNNLVFNETIFLSEVEAVIVSYL